MARSRPREAPRVVVIGAGLGGCCLAEGLRRAGVPVTVYERDSGPTVRRQGYRIHIGGIGATALAECLPATSYQLFLATSDSSGEQITVASKRLRTVRVIPGAPRGDDPAPAQVSVAVNRLTLREIMLADLGDLVRFGAEFTHYAPEGGGIRAYFADGSSVVADVLVGADGVGSRVRGQLLPEAEVSDTKTRVIYGRTLLDATTTPLLPAEVRRGFLAVRAVPRPIGLALGLLRFPEPLAEVAARFGTVLTPTEDYLMFGLAAPRRSFPRPDAIMSTMDGARLREVVLAMTSSWHPDLRALLAGCVVEENFYLPIRVSAPLAALPEGPVTLLGDAVHAMSPATGSGANIALQDAAVLTKALTGQQGAAPREPIEALREYQQEMLDYAFSRRGRYRPVGRPRSHRGSGRRRSR